MAGKAKRGVHLHSITRLLNNTRYPPTLASQWGRDNSVRQRGKVGSLGDRVVTFPYSMVFLMNGIYTCNEGESRDLRSVVHELTAYQLLDFHRHILRTLSYCKAGEVSN